MILIAASLAIPMMSVIGLGQGLAMMGQIDGTDVVVMLGLDKANARTIAVGAMRGDKLFCLGGSLDPPH
jgi:hypothetical protein